MTLDRAPGLLVEIETSIERVRVYTAGLDKAAFLARPMTCDAVALHLMVIGEAARSLPQSVRGEAPEIPWPQVVSFRHRVAHGYSSIDYKVVWSIVEDHLTPLAVAVRRMLAARDE